MQTEDTVTGLFDYLFLPRHAYSTVFWAISSLSNRTLLSASLCQMRLSLRPTFN